MRGTYMVRKESSLKAIADVDRSGCALRRGRLGLRVYLTRTLRTAHWSARRWAAARMIEMFVNDKLEAGPG